MSFSLSLTLRKILVTLGILLLSGALFGQNRAQAQQNLLVNGSFSSEGRRTIKQSVYEAAGWEFTYDEIPGLYNLYQAQLWGKWSGLKDSYDQTEYYWFWAKNSVPMYLDLAQNVSGLDTAQEYRMDIALKVSIRDWDYGYQTFEDELPKHVPVDSFFCINVFSVSTGEMTHTTGWVDPSSADQQWQRFGLTFVPEEPDVRIVINYWAPNGHNFNFAYLDDARLVPSSVPAIVAQPTHGTLEPTAVPTRYVNPISAQNGTIPIASEQPAIVHTPVGQTQVQPTADYSAVNQPQAHPTADYTAVSLQQTATAQANLPQATAVIPDPASASTATATPAAVSNANVQTTINSVANEPSKIPTPNAAGEMIYTVQSGDNLTTIARLTCGNATDCIETIKELNALTSNVLQVGQQLIVGPLPDNLVQAAHLTNIAPTAIPPTVTPQPAATEETAIAAISTTAPEEIVPTAANAAVGSICVSVYEDFDGNGTREESEVGLSGFRLRLVNTDEHVIVGEIISNAFEMPYCFESLVAGNYSTRVLLREDVAATTNPQFDTELQAGTSQSISFGVSTAAAQAVAAANTPNAVTEIPVWVVLATGTSMLGLAGLVGVGMLIRHRKRLL